MKQNYQYKYEKLANTDDGATPSIYDDEKTKSRVVQTLTAILALLLLAIFIYALFAFASIEASSIGKGERGTLKYRGAFGGKDDTDHILISQNLSANNSGHPNEDSKKPGATKLELEDAEKAVEKLGEKTSVLRERDERRREQTAGRHHSLPSKTKIGSDKPKEVRNREPDTSGDIGETRQRLRHSVDVTDEEKKLEELRKTYDLMMEENDVRQHARKKPADDPTIYLSDYDYVDENGSSQSDLYSNDNYVSATRDASVSDDSDDSEVSESSLSFTEEISQPSPKSQKDSKIIPERPKPSPNTQKPPLPNVLTPAPTDISEILKQAEERPKINPDMRKTRPSRPVIAKPVVDDSFTNDDIFTNDLSQLKEELSMLMDSLDKTGILPKEAKEVTFGLPKRMDRSESDPSDEKAGPQTSLLDNFDSDILDIPEILNKNKPLDRENVFIADDKVTPKPIPKPRQEYRRPEISESTIAESQASQIDTDDEKTLNEISELGFDSLLASEDSEVGTNFDNSEVVSKLEESKVIFETILENSQVVESQVEHSDIASKILESQGTELYSDLSDKGTLPHAPGLSEIDQFQDVQYMDYDKLPEVKSLADSIEPVEVIHDKTVEDPLLHSSIGEHIEEHKNLDFMIKGGGGLTSGDVSSMVDQKEQPFNVVDTSIDASVIKDIEHRVEPESEARGETIVEDSIVDNKKEEAQEIAEKIAESVANIEYNVAQDIHN